MATDEQELLDVQRRYAAAYDNRRPADFAAAFTHDGRLVLPDAQVIAGTEALTAFAAAAAARPFRTHHFMSNQAVWVDGDRATGAAHVAAVSQLADDVRLLLIGRYDDRMQRTTDGWRLLERVISALSPTDLTRPPA